MSGHQAAGARRGGRGDGGRGGRGRGGRGGRGSGRHHKKNRYTSNTQELKNDIFNCGDPEDVAEFEKSKKAIINYIRRNGGKECVIAAQSIEDGAVATIPKPTKPPKIPDPDQPNANPPVLIDDEAEVIMWHGELKLIPSRRLNLQQQMEQAYAIVWDQCTQTMKSKLEQLKAYENINASKDPNDLLAEIKNIVCGREAHKPPVFSMVQLMKMLVCFTQEWEMSNEDYRTVRLVIRGRGAARGMPDISPWAHRR